MTTKLVSAAATTPGLLEGLPAWAVFLISLGLVAIALVALLFNKKFFEEDSLLLWAVTFICGLGGALGLYGSIFGG